MEKGEADSNKNIRKTWKGKCIEEFIATRVAGLVITIVFKGNKIDRMPSDFHILFSITHTLTLDQ